MIQTQQHSDNITSKEISPGVILIKQVQPPARPESVLQTKQTIFFQGFGLPVQKFTADFSGSENIFMEGDLNGRLSTITVINPFDQQQVAKLTMKRDWKLKTKFKFTMKPATKDVQMKFINTDIQKLQVESQNCSQMLRKFPVSLKEINDIIKFLYDRNSKFIDSEFLPNDNSVFGYDLDHSVLDTLVQWRRAQDFFQQKDVNKKPDVFYEKIEPSDIKQGALGNCWFLSALSSLAERPALIKRLFQTQQVNSVGIYRMKICKNGEWVYITVDDLFPCYPMATPIFSSSHGNELWVLLIEKAYAKLHGSYFSLRNGYPNEAFIDLTGCPTDTIYFQDIKLQMNAFQFLWQKLLKWDEEGYLLTAFTEGQDKWTEGVRPSDDQEQIGLVAGHAYAILEIREARGNQLLNIRNPWGNFEWRGDWGDTSPLWTQEMIKELNPNFDLNDGTFWISYKDFLQNFFGVTCCKVRNWDEVRIKGKFVRVQDIDDPNIEVVMSKWYYSLEVNQKCKIIVGLHQEDERCKGVVELRPYLDIGITIFKKNDASTLDLVTMIHTKNDRQVELEWELTPGNYIILPRTTGLALRRSNHQPTQFIQLLQQNGTLHPLVESTVNDIFRKYDMLLTRELSFIEFKGFFECLEKQLDATFFKNSILANYASSDKGISLKGFTDYFRDSIATLGDEAIWKWFEKLGYDRDLYSVRSRTFLLTVHSTNELSVTVRDAVQTDLDNRGHIFAASNQDEHTQIETLQMENSGVRALSCYNRLADTFTIVAVNDLTYPVELTIDTSDSIGAIFSTKNGLVRKRIEPGQMDFMLHLKPDPTSKQKFKLEYSCGWIAV